MRYTGTVSTAAPPTSKPSWRGVSHHYAFFVSLLGLAGLVLTAPTHRILVVCVVYGVSLSALLGVSALFHRIHWTSLRARRWMGRLDHAMIGFLIAGTYTPFGVLAVAEPRATQLMTIIWAGAAASGALHILWSDAPKPLSAALYVLLGWVGVVAAPQIAAHAGIASVSLLVAGGLIYSFGAIVYAIRRPDPIPGVFGYHEVFHASVVAGAVLHYAAVMLMIAPATA